MRSLANVSRRRSGCTAPGGNGHGLSIGATAYGNRSETEMPLIGSAGCPANQPRTWVLYPFCVRMFHIAFTLRDVLVTGRTLPVCGSGSMNPRIPCLSGRFPVALELHSMGERIGRKVARLPITP